MSDPSPAPDAQVHGTLDLTGYPGQWVSNGPVALTHGTLPEVVQVFGYYGTLNAAGDNAILLTTGLTASHHAARHPRHAEPGWWDDMIGPGKPLDTERYFVVCMNPIGGCFGSTGPASLNPETGEPYRLTFPRLTVADMMRVQALVMDDLGVRHIHAVIGSSMGGMLALQFALNEGKRVSKLVSISSSGQSTASSIAYRFAQRSAIMQDPDWMAGQYPLHRQPRRGLALARMIGMLSYRSHLELNPRFGRNRVSEPKERGITYQVENFLQHLGDRLADDFDANSYLYLTRAIDHFDVAEGFASAAESLKRLSARATVVGVSSDRLFPIDEQLQLYQALKVHHPRVRFVRVDSPAGHDSFLKDPERFKPILEEALAE